MECFLEHLNKYSELISVATTIALIIVTAELTRATRNMAKSSKETSEATKLLVRENRSFREDAKKPQVLAKLKPLFEHGDFIQLVLNNAGRGVALNVRFRLQGDEQDFDSHDVSHLRGSLVPINFMSQGESETYELGAAPKLFADPPMKPFFVVINYEDVDGQSYEKRNELNVAQFKGLEWSGASVVWRQMEALERIEKKLPPK